MHDVVTVNPIRFRPPAPLPSERVRSTFAILKALRDNPIDLWTRAHFEEPIVESRLAFGRVVVVSEPAAIRKVLVENSGDYRKGAIQTRVLSVALRNGLLTVEGDQWKRQRRTLAPLFARKTVMRYAPAMAEAIDALIARWRAVEEGQALDIGAEMNRLALDVLARSCFSDGIGDNPDAMRAAMMAYVDIAGRIDPFDVMGVPDYIPRLTRWRARPLLRYFDDAVSAMIAKRRSRLAESPDEAPRDLLAALMNARDPETGEPMSEIEVKANILTFIAAGQDTTANGLTWALYLIAGSREWRDKVRAEAEAEFAFGMEGLAERLTNTRAVFDESLRLYPPITATSRAAGRRDEIAGRVIEKGTTVVVAPYIVHRHRLLWDDPDIFDPTRFLPGAPRKIERGAFIPFGSGARMCLGASFAHQEAVIVLANLVKAFDLKLAPGQTVWPYQGITLRPRDPLLMVAKAVG
jgi:cytochrome P450